MVRNQMAQIKSKIPNCRLNAKIYEFLSVESYDSPYKEQLPDQENLLATKYRPYACPTLCEDEGEHKKIGGSLLAS